MPALPAHVAASRLWWTGFVQRHADRSGSRREGTCSRQTVRLDGRPHSFRLVSGILRDERRSGARENLFRRCLPGKTAAGGDRVPAPDEIRNCSSWMNDEIDLLRPDLIIPVGKLAIAQFIPFEKLDEVVGRSFRIRDKRRAFDLIPLPHPSGASPWHRIPPGLGLLRKAMRLVARHPAMRKLKNK